MGELQDGPGRGRQAVLGRTRVIEEHSIERAGLREHPDLPAQADEAIEDFALLRRLEGRDELGDRPLPGADEDFSGLMVKGDVIGVPSVVEQRSEELVTPDECCPRRLLRCAGG
jgi:hypothetical protein